MLINQAGVKFAKGQTGEFANRTPFSALPSGNNSSVGAGNLKRPACDKMKRLLLGENVVHGLFIWTN